MATTETRICKAIERSWARDWTSPSVRGLAAETGISVEHAHIMLGRMVASGLLEVKRVSSQRVLYRVVR